MSLVSLLDPIPWWVKYVVVAAVGGAGVYFAYAVPRIASLEQAAAEATAAAAQEKVKFQEGARDEQQRLQGLVDAAQNRADASRLELARARDALGVSTGKLRDTERALQDHLARLPEAASCPAVVSAARALGDVEQRMEEFGGRCTNEVERLGIEVRRLEQTP
jgi:hypothetical protein